MATQAANLSQMSVRDLKAKLDAIDVDYTTALDKSELVRLISDSMPAAAASNPLDSEYDQHYGPGVSHRLGISKC